MNRINQTMANHKRGRPKNARAGCLLCKPHKANGADRRTTAEIRRDEADRVDARAELAPEHWSDYMDEEEYEDMVIEEVRKKFG
jgi:hypothetical protein